jgi:hypothetical protein
MTGSIYMIWYRTGRMNEGLNSGHGGNAASNVEVRCGSGVRGCRVGHAGGDMMMPRDEGKLVAVSSTYRTYQWHRVVNLGKYCDSLTPNTRTPQYTMHEQREYDLRLCNVMLSALRTKQEHIYLLGKGL